MLLSDLAPEINRYLFPDHTLREPNACQDIQKLSMRSPSISNSGILIFGILDNGTVIFGIPVSDTLNAARIQPDIWYPIWVVVSFKQLDQKRYAATLGASLWFGRRPPKFLKNVPGTSTALFTRLLYAFVPPDVRSECCHTRRNTRI